MIERRSGSIINISSISAHTGLYFYGGYCASKGAVASYSRAVAVYCAQNKLGIRCNSIHPGSVETPILQQVHKGPMEERHIQARAKAIPMRRIGQPHEIARPILFLASDDASFITGTELVVDGGYTAR